MKIEASARVSRRRTSAARGRDRASGEGTHRGLRRRGPDKLSVGKRGRLGNAPGGGHTATGSRVEPIPVRYRPPGAAPNLGPIARELGRTAERRQPDAISPETPGIERLDSDKRGRRGASKARASATRRAPRKKCGERGEFDRRSLMSPSVMAESARESRGPIHPQMRVINRVIFLVQYGVLTSFTRWSSCPTAGESSRAEGRGGGSAHDIRRSTHSGQTVGVRLYRTACSRAARCRADHAPLGARANPGSTNARTTA